MFNFGSALYWVRFLISLKVQLGSPFLMSGSHQVIYGN
jgi:hypothetical protein